MTTEAVRISSFQAETAYETRLWIAVIATLLLAEVWLHVLGHQAASLWGVIPAGVLLAVTVVAYQYYRGTERAPWIIITVPLSIIGLSIAADAVGLQLLADLDLTSFVYPGGQAFGAEGPTHGLLAVGHLFADLSVIGIGIYQLVRWFRLRKTRVALSGIAAFTGCCGTTAILLAPVFSAVLGVFGIHSGVSFVMVATLLTAALVAIAYASTGGIPFRRARAQV